MAAERERAACSPEPTAAEEEPTARARERMARSAEPIAGSRAQMVRSEERTTRSRERAAGESEIASVCFARLSRGKSKWLTMFSGSERPARLHRQLRQCLREDVHSFFNLLRRRIFVRPMAHAAAAGNENHGGRTNLRHEQRIMIGSADHLAM
jgi:hypothetical protein